MLTAIERLALQSVKDLAGLPEPPTTREANIRMVMADAQGEKLLDAWPSVLVPGLIEQLLGHLVGRGLLGLRPGLRVTLVAKGARALEEPEGESRDWHHLPVTWPARWCEACGKPLRLCPSGLVCEEGHGCGLEDGLEEAPSEGGP